MEISGTFMQCLCLFNHNALFISLSLSLFFIFSLFTIAALLQYSTYRLPRALSACTRLQSACMRLPESRNTDFRTWQFRLSSSSWPAVKLIVLIYAINLLWKSIQMYTLRIIRLVNGEKNNLKRWSDYWSKLIYSFRVWCSINLKFCEACSVKFLRRFMQIVCMLTLK